MADKHHDFDEARWAAEREARKTRMEIDAARRQVSAGQAERITKPGEWRVCWAGPGDVVTEIFS